MQKFQAFSVLLTVSILGGCSTPDVKPERPPYCSTEETVVLKNGKQVQSQAIHYCTDDQVKKLTKHRMGIAPNCGTYTYWIKKGGYDVQRQGISCQKPDGSWEIVHTAGY